MIVSPPGSDKGLEPAVHPLRTRGGAVHRPARRGRHRIPDRRAVDLRGVGDAKRSEPVKQKGKKPHGGQYGFHLVEGRRPDLGNRLVAPAPRDLGQSRRLGSLAGRDPAVLARRARRGMPWVGSPLLGRRVVRIGRPRLGQIELGQIADDRTSSAGFRVGMPASRRLAAPGVRRRAGHERSPWHRNRTGSRRRARGLRRRTTRGLATRS